MLKRSKRSNQVIFEEIKSGNLERECLEEMCALEEALEAFDDKESGLNWWYWKTHTCENLPTCDKVGTKICLNTVCLKISFHELFFQNHPRFH